MLRISHNSDLIENHFISHCPAFLSLPPHGTDQASSNLREDRVSNPGKNFGPWKTGKGEGVWLLLQT